jgi:IS1 family transposase
LDRGRLVLALRMLLEGNSVRSTERLTRIHRDTIIAAMVRAGEACERFLEMAIRRVPVSDVQVDELWGFVGCKQKLADRKGYGPERGDAYCFVGIERHTKLILTWHLGKRCPEDTQTFAEKLWRATSARFQLTTDGYTPYLTAIPSVFGPRIDYATLVKVYGDPPQEEARRYSPPRITDTIATVRLGQPDKKRICTSHIERANKTLRMQIRRLTRLTDGHSKKWENHQAALALFFCYYNWCRVHSTLGTTPAVESGLTDHVWSVEELLATVAS